MMLLNAKNNLERLKIKVKVMKMMKNTVLTVTPEPDMLETSDSAQNVPKVFAHHMHMVRSVRVRITFSASASALRYHLHFFCKYIY